MNIRINKKQILKEFVDDEGALMSSKVPMASSGEIESDITTDNFMKKTRQGASQSGGPGGQYGASFGMIHEDEEIHSAVMNASNELKVAIETAQMAPEDIKNLLKYIYNDIKSGK